MPTAAIDLDMLNELLDNQKKLDDVFNFDDDFFLGSSMSYDDELGSSDQIDSQGYHSYGELSFESDDILADQESRSIIYFIVPVAMELAVIYYGVMYFI